MCNGSFLCFQRANLSLFFETTKPFRYLFPFFSIFFIQRPVSFVIIAYLCTRNMECTFVNSLLLLIIVLTL